MSCSLQQHTFLFIENDRREENERFVSDRKAALRERIPAHRATQYGAGTALDIQQISNLNYNINSVLAYRE